MAKWTDYPTKTTPADTDDLMIYDATGKANKRVLFSGLWNWIVDKLTNAVINNLQTNNKTILGALNELNSKALNEKTVTYSTVTISKDGYTLLNNLSEGVPEDLKIKQAGIATYGKILPAGSFNVYVNTVSRKAYVFGNPNAVISDLSVRFYYTV